MDEVKYLTPLDLARMGLYPKWDWNVPDDTRIQASDIAITDGMLTICGRSFPCESPEAAMDGLLKLLRMGGADKTITIEEAQRRLTTTILSRDQWIKAQDAASDRMQEDSWPFTHLTPKDIRFDKGEVTVGDLRFDSSSPRLLFARILEALFDEPRAADSVIIGSGCHIHRSATIGGSGFGYEWDQNFNKWLRIKHFGRVVIGDNVIIGEHVNIHRGVTGDTIIGDGTKIDAGVHIAHNCEIGRNCLIIAGAVLCGSVELGDNVWVAPNATIKEHVKVGDGAVIGLGAVVLRDVPPGDTWVGNPAKRIVK